MRLGEILPAIETRSDESPESHVAAQIAATRRLTADLANDSIPPTADSATLAGRLALIHGLMTSGVGFRIFYTSIGGFDTHVAQGLAHQELLQSVSQGVGDFMNLLRGSELAERVVVLIYSEFGRRLNENGQAGTDHGAAARRSERDTEVSLRKVELSLKRKVRHAAL